MKAPEPWVVSQHRTMARWISSKVDATVTDVTSDLCDGLLLIKLVNCIATETGTSNYVLTPVYSKPTFHIQKVENVDDMLKYCRLVLQVNVSTVSADNVVGGDLKLILGLIWTLFVFSSARRISFQNEGRSAGEIKVILLGWLNTLVRSRALPEVSNFTKDWSLQRERRPDLVFAAILDSYIPKKTDYSAFVHGKKVANLQSIVSLASDLGIPELATAEDFNVLVPEEKCIIFYVLQWYLFFECGTDSNGDPDSVTLPASEPAKDKQQVMSEFIEVVLETVRIKNRYETKALRFVNQLTTNTTKLTAFQDLIISAESVIPKLNTYCADITSPELLDFRTLEGIVAPLTEVETILKTYENFKLNLKPAYMYHDFPELQALYKSIRNNLQKEGISGYQPNKLLTLEALRTRLEGLHSVDQKFGAVLAEFMEKFSSSELRNLDKLLDKLGKVIVKPVLDSTKLYVDNIDWISRMRKDLESMFSCLKQHRTTSDIRALIGSLELIEVPITPDSLVPQQLGFDLFKDAVKALTNQSNLSYSDVRAFLRGLQQQWSVDNLKNFMLLIPSRRLLSRSESDEFVFSDESDDLSSLFDEIQKKLEHKLSGNHNKLYDIADFVRRIEIGFKV